jgi:hypothetical protein
MRWRKSSQLLDEEDMWDACEKSKARGTATAEKKSSVTELVEKETSLPTEMPPLNTVACPVIAVKPEKDEKVKPDSEQDDPTGNLSCCWYLMFLHYWKFI